VQFRLECHEVLDSTSSLVKQRAEDGAAEGLAIQALRQSAGRGRQGRGWDSPAGNLYLSVLLRPDVPLREAPQWSFVAAVALAETLNALLPEVATLKLKWPNDVLLQGAKAAGILVETGVATNNALDWICIGMGVNIATKPSLPDRPTACLAEYLGAPRRRKPWRKACWKGWRIGMASGCNRASRPSVKPGCFMRPRWAQQFHSSAMVR
jgi:BirA family biotin operon repressor/biotin-[acetyl-CoA-carboxylase] ligase